MRNVLCGLMLALLGASASAADEYVPLAVGQESVFAVTIAQSQGQTSEGVAHRKIESSVEKDGKTYFQARTWTDGLAHKVDYTKLFRRDEKAVYSIDGRVAGAREQIEMALPIKEGATWQQTTGGMIITIKVLGLENIEVGGKTYEKCYHVRAWSTDGAYATKDGVYTGDSWEAPIVGTVKTEITMGRDIKLTFLLKEFTPGK